MRSLKSTSSTSTLKGKRKLAQTKDYPDSPPATPPHHNGKTTTTRVTKKQVFELNSPPAKRRRSSDRIANKAGQKRQSMEDDDGFVFTRPSKQKRKHVPEEVEAEPKVRQPTKPSFMDFTEVTCSCERDLKVDPCCDEKSISTIPTTETHSAANRYSNRS